MKTASPLLVVALAVLTVGCDDASSPDSPNTAGVNYVDARGDDASVGLVDGVEGVEDSGPAEPDVGPDVEEAGSDVVEPEPDIVEPDPTEGPVEMNSGWIGGPCPDDLACDYDTGSCLLDTEGFPDGHCTQPCDLYCPDQPGAVVTYCVTPEDLGMTAPEGLCVMQCDFGLSPTGCRAGYYCASVPRYGEPDTLKLACLPGEAPAVEMSDCMLELMERGVGFHVGVNPMASPDGHPNLVCDVSEPVWVDGTLAGVNYRYAATDGEVKRIFAGCELALAMHDTATLVAVEGVTDIVHLGVYNCRVISGTSTLSQHAFANAIDIAGFQFDDGAYWTVYDDWEDGVPSPVTDSGDWLLWFANELYQEWFFNIVLTPEFNAAHDDHFHCDLTPGEHSLH